MSLFELNPTTALMLVNSAPTWFLLTFALWLFGKDADKWSVDLAFGFSLHLAWLAWTLKLLWG